MVHGLSTLGLLLTKTTRFVYVNTGQIYRTRRTATSMLACLSICFDVEDLAGS
jgi:cytidylate kinase